MNLRGFSQNLQFDPPTMRYKRITMVTVPQNQEFQNDSLRYENLQERGKMKNHFYDYLCMILILRVKTLNMQVKKSTNIYLNIYISKQLVVLW